MDRLEEKRRLFQEKRAVLRKNPEFVRQYEEHFLVQYTYDSTSIEGNSLTKEETRRLLVENLTPANKNLREIYEQVNHKTAFEYAVSQVNRGKELDEGIVLKMHELIVNNIFPGGKYRTCPVYIQGSAHECPFPEELPAYLEGFYRKLAEKNMVCGLPESGTDALGLACWTHCEFVSIHPFRDGNGRTSRLMMNYQLLRHGYVPVSIPVDGKAEYYRVLEEYHLNHDMEPFRKMVYGMEEKELDYLLGQIRLLEHYPEGGMDIGLS